MNIINIQITFLYILFIVHFISVLHFHPLLRLAQKFRAEMKKASGSQNRKRKVALEKEYARQT
jgi:hypothetical protein